MSDAWQRNPGATLKGRVTDIDTFIGGEYDNYPVLTVETTDGSEVTVHAFHTVLQRELAKRDVQVGDEVEILYQGKSGPKSTDYERYRVRNISRQPSRYDYSKLAGVAEDEAEPQPQPQSALPGKPADDDEDVPF